jgi:hypothetical protein
MARRALALAVVLALFMHALLRTTALAQHAAAHLQHVCPDDAFSNDGTPLVNCARSPPCVQQAWLNVDKCRTALRLDRDWPTHDPYIKRNASWHTPRNLLHDYLRGKVFVMVGDSVGKLIYMGFACEVARHELSISFVHERLDAFWRKVEAVPESAWENGPPDRGYHVSDSDTLMTQKGWSRPSPSDTKALLGMSDVLVLNYGLHFHDLAEYQLAMEALFAELGAFNRLPGKLAVFRETSAQSFPGTGSYTPGAEHTSSACVETPAAAAFSNHVWQQNQIVRRLGAEHGVPILDFYNLTLARWTMYEERKCKRDATASECAASEVDCTHLCMTPTLWASMVDALYNILSAHLQKSI